ncbi:MAG TPA: YMGG-like glycine zipper-containing protein [Stellaceae bacterium]|jgi:hypothetical protein|nr:YMGG-like glycine zipper-containing protein [Stellaceae bacterium]
MKPLDARPVSVFAAALMLSGCVGPMGPAPELMPPPTPAGISADQTCRQYADAQTAPMRNQANVNTVGSTLVGAGLGAALGAAVGGGRGAGIGAASGAVLGTGVGAANAQNAAADIQQQYNAYYANCMSSHGGPPPGYGAPPPGYGAPPPGYGAPPSGYGAPPPGYGQPGYPPPPPHY